MTDILRDVNFWPWMFRFPKGQLQYASPMKPIAQPKTKIEQWEILLTFLKILDKLENYQPEPIWVGAGEYNQ